MKVAVFSPYGSTHKESGLVYLLANFLAKRGADVAQLRCDGALSVCGRGRGAGLARSPFECASCMREQRELANWAGIASKDISSDIVSDDIVQTVSWLRKVPREALARVEFRGVNLWNLCRDEFNARFEGGAIECLNPNQESELRGLFASSVRAAVASERFLEQVNPELVLVPSSFDPVVGAFTHESLRRGIDTAVCSFESETESLSVEFKNSGKNTYTTQLVLEGITAMRSDPRTWGAEVTAVVYEIMTFLGRAPDRVG
jgi:hypothetical protein